MNSYVDASNNRIVVYPTDQTFDGRPLVIVRLINNPSRGYIALNEGIGGGFGDESCPSSYGMACLSWFGEGERYPTADAALAAITVD